MVISKLDLQNREWQIFQGSNFKIDQSESKLYKIISQIVDCVEAGKVCIVSYSSSFYENFYDLLNQNYTQSSDRQFCRIAFGSD
jgi:hypothetical protein